MLVLLRPRKQQRPPQLGGQGAAAGDGCHGVAVAGDLVLVAVGLDPGVADEGPICGTPAQKLCPVAGDRRRGQSCLIGWQVVWLTGWLFRFQCDFDSTGSGNFLNKTYYSEC